MDGRWMDSRGVGEEVEGMGTVWVLEPPTYTMYNKYTSA